MRDKMLNMKSNADPAAMARSCRMRAEEMFTIASSMKQAEPRHFLERQAKEWTKLAEVAERNARASSAQAPSAAPVTGKRDQKRAQTEEAFLRQRDLDQQASLEKSQRLKMLLSAAPSKASL